MCDKKGEGWSFIERVLWMMGGSDVLNGIE
jgi:hypothetical protein